jgi:hypothetical protein
MSALRFSGVVGLDPAWSKPCVAAYVVRDGTWVFAEAAHDDWEAWARLFGAAVDAGCRRVVIEEPYQGASVQTFRLLVTAVAQLEGYAVAAGLEVTRVNTQTWMSAMLTVNGHTPKVRKELLERMVYVARLLGAKVEPAQDDRASAVCLAEFGRCLGRVVL